MMMRMIMMRVTKLKTFNIVHIFTCMLHWKSSSNEKVWCAKQLIFAVCLQTVCRVKHWILPGYGSVIFIYTYIYILLPGHGREGYWIAANIVILDDTILYCIFVSLVANHCNGVMHVWQSWAKLLNVSQISRSAWFSFSCSTLTWKVKSSAPEILEILLRPSGTGSTLTVINTCEGSFGSRLTFFPVCWLLKSVSNSISLTRSAEKCWVMRCPRKKKTSHRCCGNLFSRVYSMAAPEILFNHDVIYRAERRSDSRSSENITHIKIEEGWRANSDAPGSDCVIALAMVELYKISKCFFQ